MALLDGWLNSQPSPDEFILDDTGSVLKVRNFNSVSPFAMGPTQKKITCESL